MLAAVSSRIEDLAPDVQDMALALLQQCARQGLLLRVTQTYRTLEEQAALYAKGRTAPGEPCHHQGILRAIGTCPTHPLGAAVTNAPPGYSWHNFRRAFDVAEQDKTPYDLGVPGPRDDDALWEKIGGIGESLGLIWGGRWKFPDRPHFEHHGGKTLAEFRQYAKDEGLLA